MCRMPILTLKILVLSFLLATICAEAEDSVDPAPPAPPAPEIAKAEKLLERAITFQGGERFSKPGAVKNLTVRMSCHIWDYSSEEPKRNAIMVIRYLQLIPKVRFRSEWIPSVDHIIRGFDGTRYWYKDDKLNRRLNGDPYKKSRDEIDEKIAETKHLLRLFFLSNLKAENVQFKFLKEEKVQVGQKEISCDVVRRENLDPESTEPMLTLWLGSEDGSLVKAAARPQSAKARALTFIFHYMKGANARIEGVHLPFRIELYEQPDGLESPRISLRATFLEKEEGGIDFTTELDSKLFTKPPRKAKAPRKVKAPNPK